MAATGCDGARDEGYRGEVLHTVRVALTVGATPDPLLAPEANLTLSLRWAVPGGFVDAAPGDVVATRVDVNDTRLEVLRPPPAEAMRADGMAIGQLIAFTDRDHDGRPDEVVGASATLVQFTPARGFVTVRAAAPCDVPTSFIPVPADEVAAVTAYMGFPHASLFSDPGCVDHALALLGERCPAHVVVRWVCRFGPGAENSPYRLRLPLSNCAPCMPNEFPEGATPAQCDAWRTRCVEQTAEPTECAAEWRVCVAGEPPAPMPCDLGCACERSFDWCLERYERDFCVSKAAGCDWRQLSGTGP